MSTTLQKKNKCFGDSTSVLRHNYFLSLLCTIRLFQEANIRVLFHQPCNIELYVFQKDESPSISREKFKCYARLFSNLMFNTQICHPTSKTLFMALLDLMKNILQIVYQNWPFKMVSLLRTLRLN